MKVHLHMHDARGVLFCGFVEAPSVVAAMTLKLQELCLTRHVQPGAMRIEAKPVFLLTGASSTSEPDTGRAGA